VKQDNDWVELDRATAMGNNGQNDAPRVSLGDIVVTMTANVCARTTADRSHFGMAHDNTHATTDGRVEAAACHVHANAKRVIRAQATRAHIK